MHVIEDDRKSAQKHKRQESASWTTDSETDSARSTPMATPLPTPRRGSTTSK